MRAWPALDLASLGDPDLMQAALADWPLTAVDERGPDDWRVYFHTPEDRDRAARVLASQFPGLSIAPIDVPDEDWAARSQASLRAVSAGDFVIAPPWDVPSATPAGSRVIVILPSTGFGTGHHATTRLCLRALSRLDLVGRTVLDVGTGSGVLAIAAHLLGARSVRGIDDDPDAIEAARENVARNKAGGIILEVGDIRAAGLAPVDVVLANLTGGLLVSAAADLQRLVTPGGRLVLSGLMREEAAGVLAAYAPCTLIDRSEEEDWGCLVLEESEVQGSNSEL